MSLAYTAPTWEDGSGTGISASQLQALCNCVEGLVQGSDKAVSAIAMANSVITLTFADGTQETVTATGLKGVSSIEKTGSVGLVDTYTVTYTDGTTSTFEITNGADGTYPTITASATADATSSSTPTVTVTKTGTDDAPNFDFAFSGLKGAQGDQGPTGAGVPSGGTTGQVLKKASGTDFDTEWANESGGGGSTVTVDHDGTASDTGVRKQRIGIDGVYYDVDGSAYMEKTANSASFVFTNSTYITSDTVVDGPYTDTWGDNPSNVVTDGSAHTVTVTFSAAQTRTVRIYLK